MAEFSTYLMWNIILAAALAVSVALVGKLSFIRNRPAVLHLLWLLVLVKLVTPPLFRVPVHWESEGGAADSSLAFVEPSREEIRQANINTSAADNSGHVDGEDNAPPVESSDPEADSVQEEVRAPSAPNQIAPIPWATVLAALSILGTVVLVLRGVFVMRKVSQLIRRANGGNDRL